MIVIGVALADGVIIVLILHGNVLADNGSGEGELASGDGVGHASDNGITLHHADRGGGGAAVVPKIAFEPLRCTERYLSAVAIGKREFVIYTPCSKIGVPEVGLIGAVIRGELQLHGLPRESRQVEAVGRPWPPHNL